MGRTLGLTSGLLCLLVVAIGDVAAQKQKNQVTPEVATDQDYKQLQSIKDMTGKLASINTMSVTFRLDIPHLEPNPKYRPPKGNNAQYQQLHQIYRQQAQILATRNPFQRQLRMQQLMATLQRDQYQQLMLAAAANSKPNNQPFLLAHQYKDFDLELSDKVVLRKMVLETQYDDKGNIKEYSKEDKDKLRGKDTTKPGYQAKMEDLQAGQQVKVYLKMPKKAKPVVDSAKEDKAAEPDKAEDKAEPAANKAKNKDAADDKTEIVRPIITMIVILQSLDAPLVPDNVPVKKKNAN